MANIEDRIKSQLERGNISLAKESLKEKYLKEDKADWYRFMQEEHDSVYKLKEVIQETIVFDEVLQEEVTTTEVVGFDYLDDAPAFPDWLNETRVITEAIEATYDEDGIVLTEAVAEVTELVRPYTPLDVTDRVDAYINGKYKELRAKEYPAIEDYVDAVVKDDIVAIEEYKAKCLAIKAKYPKP